MVHPQRTAAQLAEKLDGSNSNKMSILFGVLRLHNQLKFSEFNYLPPTQANTISTFDISLFCEKE